MAGRFEILLVEDYELDAKLALLLFKKHRIANKVHVIRDGVEALDFVFCRGAHRDRSLDDPPGVVILDIRLPKLDGWEVLHKIRQDLRTKNIPVVLTSGSILPEDLEKSRQLGVNGLIQKPIEFEELSACLRGTEFRWVTAGQDDSARK